MVDNVEYFGIYDRDQEPRSTTYVRPEETFAFLINRTAQDESFTQGEHFRTGIGISIVKNPLNQRLELGFLDIEKLEDDWDTYGGKAPSSETIKLAKSICEFFPSRFQPEIIPESDGSVSLYWDFDVTFCIRVNSSNSANTALHLEFPNGQIIEDSVSDPFEAAYIFRSMLIKENE